MFLFIFYWLHSSKRTTFFFLIISGLLLLVLHNSFLRRMLNETKAGENMSTTTTQVPSSTSNVEIVRQQRFEVGPRYTDLKFVGEGAYGTCIINSRW